MTRVNPAHMVIALELPLQPLALAAETILEGQPQTFHAPLEVSSDGRVRSGVWEITPGVVSDVEVEEMFVVLKGRARVSIEGGAKMDLAPGCVGFLRAGDRAVWQVSETLRKVYVSLSQP